MRWSRSGAGWAFGVVVLCALGCEVTYRAMSGNRGPESEGRDAATDRAAVAGAYGEIPACEGGDPCLRVLTFNTKHRDVPIQMAAVSQALQRDLDPLPDFVLLQEVVFDRPPEKGHENTAAVLADQLGLEVRGTAREDGIEGIAILSRYPFEHYDWLHLSARDKFLSGGFPRVSVMGEFRVGGIGLVRVVNVHLAHRPSVNDIREAQLEETLEWMAARQRAAPADVVVLGGDFNIEPGWPEMAALAENESTITGGSMFVDLNSRAYTSGKVGAPHRRVDYIYAAAPELEIRGVGEGVLWRDGIPTVDGMATFSPSDHLPLLHVFSVAGE